MRTPPSRALELAAVAALAGVVGYLVGTTQAPEAREVVALEGVQPGAGVGQGGPLGLAPGGGSGGRPGAGSPGWGPGSGPGVRGTGSGAGGAGGAGVAGAGVGGSGAGNPGAGNPGAGNPGAGRPGAGHPGAGSPGAGDPGVRNPVARPGAGGRAVLRVTARDAGTKAPLERFWLHLKGGGGSRTLELSPGQGVELTPGRVLLAVSAPAYHPQERTLDLEAGEQRLDLPLEPAPAGVLEGQVHLTGEPTPFLVHVDGVGRVFDDPQGRFRIEGVLAGAKLVGFARDDLALFEEQTRVEVRAGETTWVEVSLAHPGRIVGVVEDSVGEPVPGALVSAANSVSGTDESGRFSLVALQPGEHLVRVLTGTHDALEVPVVVEEGRDSERRLRLPAAAGARLAGRVEGAPSGAAVLLRAPGDERPRRLVQVAAGGTFAFPDLAPGEYRLTCGAVDETVHLGSADLTDLVLGDQ